jgi:hypothetical protein
VGALGKESDLVETLGNTLSECSDIVDAVGEFIDSHLTPDERRRLDKDEGETTETSLVDDVGTKLGTCTSVVEAVDNFKMMYKALMEPDEDLSNMSNDTFKDPIILNIGGERFTTTLATLRAKNGTYLEKMFREGATTTSSADGSYFIDRDPSTFDYILEYLRNDDVLVKSRDKSVRSQILADAAFFELSESLEDYLRWSSLRDGIDLTFSEFSFLNKELKVTSKELGGLLYQASKDGDSASTFHSRCDSKGPTVVIVESTAGNMFGGFTDQAWSSSAGYSSSTTAFLFQLRPDMKRYNKHSSSSSNAIYRNSGYGPTFGGGHDLHISSSCTSVTTSYTNGGNAYDLPNYELNGGERNFRVKDYVVVQAESL